MSGRSIRRSAAPIFAALVSACATTGGETRTTPGDAAGPASTQSLYDKYGGAPTVRKVVHDAAIAFFRDCHIAPYLAAVGKPGHTSADRFESCLVLQFSALMGGKDASGRIFTYPGRAVSLADGSATYDCQDMATVHSEVGIPGNVFDQLVSDLVASMQADGMTGADIQQLAPHILGLKPQTVSATPSNLDTSSCQLDTATGQVTSPDHSLYAKYGGAATVRKVVTDAIHALVTDCRVSPYFASVGQPGHATADRVESCLNLQISALLGGRRTDADGKPLTDAQGNPIPFRYPGVAGSFEGLVDGEGNPVTYHCVDMVSSHAYLGISPTAYDAFLGDLATALAADGVSSSDIQAMAAAIAPIKPQIVSATPTVLPACTSASGK